jgi:hypothetical protein
MRLSAEQPLPVLLLALIAAGGCYEPALAGEFQVVISSHSDRGDALAGVEIWGEGALLGTTNASGGLAVTISAIEGTPFSLQAVCPRGYRSPDRPTALLLRGYRSLSSPARAEPLGVEFLCRPAIRAAAVVIRAGGQADLPVQWHGREVARTDPHGVAHLLLQVAPNSTFTVGLDTSARPRLEPQSALFTFTIGDQDDIFMVDQPFAERPEPRRARRRKKPTPPPPAGPVRLDSRRKRKR